jgi:RNA recognition motif-containing protein
MFDKYGKIIEINIKEKRDKFAFIEFADIREAENALK